MSSKPIAARSRLFNNAAFRKEAVIKSQQLETAKFDSTAGLATRGITLYGYYVRSFPKTSPTAAQKHQIIIDPHSLEQLLDPSLAFPTPSGDGIALLGQGKALRQSVKKNQPAEPAFNGASLANAAPRPVGTYDDGQDDGQDDAGLPVVMSAIDGASTASMLEKKVFFVAAFFGATTSVASFNPIDMGPKNGLALELGDPVIMTGIEPQVFYTMTKPDEKRKKVAEPIVYLSLLAKSSISYFNDASVLPAFSGQPVALARYIREHVPCTLEGFKQLPKSAILSFQHIMPQREVSDWNAHEIEQELAIQRVAGERLVMFCASAKIDDDMSEDEMEKKTFAVTRQGMMRATRYGPPITGSADLVGQGHDDEAGPSNEVEKMRKFVKKSRKNEDYIEFVVQQDNECFWVDQSDVPHTRRVRQVVRLMYGEQASLLTGFTDPAWVERWGQQYAPLLRFAGDFKIHVDDTVRQKPNCGGDESVQSAVMLAPSYTESLKDAKAAHYQPVVWTNLAWIVRREAFPVPAACAVRYIKALPNVKVSANGQITNPRCKMNGQHKSAAIPSVICMNEWDGNMAMIDRTHDFYVLLLQPGGIGSQRQRLAEERRKSPSDEAFAAQLEKRMNEVATGDELAFYAVQKDVGHGLDPFNPYVDVVPNAVAVPQVAAPETATSGGSNGTATTATNGVKRPVKKVAAAAAAVASTDSKKRKIEVPAKAVIKKPRTPVYEEPAAQDDDDEDDAQEDVAVEDDDE